MRGADSDKALRTAISRLVRQGDEVGLYVQPFKHFIDAAGVKYRDEPSYWGVPAGAAEAGLDRGGDLAITAYGSQEIAQLIKFQLSKLDQLGFSCPSAAPSSVAGWRRLQSSMPSRTIAFAMIFPPCHLTC